MRTLDFTHSIAGDVHRFVYAPGDDLVVERHNWPVLTSDWTALEDRPSLRFAVNNNNAEEVAVYLGLLWEITSGLHRWAMPVYYRDQAARLLGCKPRFVAWEYEVDATEQDPAKRDAGFVAARSAVHIPASEYETAHRAQAGLFAVTRFEELVSLTRATLGDASSEVTIFALADAGSVDHLVERLQCRTAPTLADFARLRRPVRGPDTRR